VGAGFQPFHQPHQAVPFHGGAASRAVMFPAPDVEKNRVAAIVCLGRIVVVLDDDEPLVGEVAEF
jgi:hypothetical protein